MACQANPKTYSFMFRCPLEENAPEKLRFEGHLRRRRTRRARQGARAKLKTLADEAGVTASAFVARLLRDRVGERALTEKEQQWYDEHLEMNKVRRERADRLSKQGYFNRKRRGRPRKPGPRKGWKKNGVILKVSGATE